MSRKCMQTGIVAPYLLDARRELPEALCLPSWHPDLARFDCHEAALGHEPMQLLDLPSTAFLGLHRYVSFESRA